MMFGWTGFFAARERELLYVGGKLAQGLGGPAEQATAALGYDMAERAFRGTLTISSEGELCNYLNSTVGNPAPSLFPGAEPGQWASADKGQQQNLALCQPCSEQLSPYYGHTVPVLSSNPAGKSLFANRPGHRDPFYIDQLPKYVGAPWEGELAEPSLSYLSAELCNDLSHPEDFSRTRGFCGYSG
jgi:hypothetical protein